MTNDQIIHEELKQVFRVSENYLLRKKSTSGETEHCFYTMETSPAFGEVVGVYTEKTGNKRTRNFRVSLN